MKKISLMNIESVYTANAFVSGGRTLVGAGSETTPAVYLQDLTTGESSLVADCPGGVMSFVPVPEHEDVYFSVMGLFPGFQGLEAGIHMHVYSEGKWTTRKVFDLPFAHRCDVVRRDGKNYLFAVSCSRHKDSPADWSRAGDIYVMELDETSCEPGAEVLVGSGILRNHGMLELDGRLDGSGAEGIFRLELTDGKWSCVRLFDREVSEFGFVDLDGDGQEELATIEPFHGENLRLYRKEDGVWVEKFCHHISFGHGLSCGMLNGKPVVVTGNRRGSFTLDLIRVNDLSKGDCSVEQIEQEAGPTQTQVLNINGKDCILSANQKRNEVAIYTED